MKKSLEKNRCGYCEKVFCCIECRNKHEKKNHPAHGSNCLFCRGKDVQTRYFEDPEILCHVVINHLPLYCKFCGDEFRSIEDLQSLGRCRLWSVKKTLPQTPSSLVDKETSGPVKIYTRKEGSLDREYTGNFGSFTSPPELSRNTSTPMHGGIVQQNTNCEYKIAKTPNFSFKTPKTPSLTERKAEDSQNIDGSSKDSWDAHFVSFSQLWKANSKIEDTPLRSALPFSQRVRGQDSRKESIINSGRKLGAMQEEVQDMELTGVQGSDILLASDINGGELPTPPDITSGSNKSKKERRDSNKRVRFSDQFATTGSFEVTESEFYDARETITDSMSTGQSSLNKAQMSRENEKNAEKENTESNEIPKHSPETNTRLASSSRVVMMVLVEKTGELSPSSLAPLIDSSIRKLEERSSESIYSSIISNLSASQTSASRSFRRSTSLDNYRQSSVEHFSNSPEVSTKPQVTEISTASGIFSAVAQAMKYAFSNLTGVGTLRNVCREPVSQSAKSLSRSWTSESILVTPASTSSVLSRKRPRDIVDIMPTRQRDTPETENESWSPLAKRQRGWYKIKAREPIARMRTLEANQAAVTRGVSSETQRFTQGSLSVGDTVLPIPARAHQSTQTD